MSDANAKRKSKPRRKLVADPPALMTHREAAVLFRVTSAALRKWVAKGEFPAPHSIICKTWYYRQDVILHRIKVGEWPEGVRFVEG